MSINLPYKKKIKRLITSKVELNDMSIVWLLVVDERPTD